MKLIGVKALNTSEELQCLRDQDWLSKQTNSWFIELFRFLKQKNLQKDELKDLPIIRCESGKSGHSILTSCSQQPIYFPIDSDSEIELLSIDLKKLTPIAFLDGRLWDLLSQEKDGEGLKQWLTDFFSIYPFSIENFCIDLIEALNTNIQKVPDKLIFEATEFLLKFAPENLDWGDLPVILHDGKRVIISKAASTIGDKQIVVPENFNNEDGWQHIWITANDRSHFTWLSNQYSSLISREDLFSKLRIDQFPRFKKIWIFDVNSGLEEERAFLSACRSKSSQAHASKAKVTTFFWPEVIIKSLPQELPMASCKALIKMVLVSFHKNKNLLPENLHELGLKMKGNYFKRENWQIFQSSIIEILLKRTKWLKTKKGLFQPVLSFIKSTEINQIFGDLIPYCEEEIPVEILKVLGVNFDLSLDNLLYFITISKMNSNSFFNRELSEKLYQRLGLFTENWQKGNIWRKFNTEELIFIPEATGDKGSWHSPKTVFWKSVGELASLKTIPIERVYPRLREFFINCLQIPEHANPELLAEHWLKLQDSKENRERELNEEMTPLFRELLPIAKAEIKPPWWASFISRAKFFTQKCTFEAPSEVYVPDDEDLRRKFQNSGISFAFRVEKDSFADWEKMYRAFGLKYLSETVVLKYDQPLLPSVSSAPKKFVTVPSIKMLASLLRENFPEAYQERLDDGTFALLLDIVERPQTQDVGLTFCLNTTSISLEITDCATVFWHREQNALIYNEGAESLRQSLARHISKQLLKRREFKTIEDSVALALGEINTSWAKNKGYSIPQEINRLINERNLKEIEETEDAVSSTKETHSPLSFQENFPPKKQTASESATFSNENEQQDSTAKESENLPSHDQPQHPPNNNSINPNSGKSSTIDLSNSASSISSQLYDTLNRPGQHNILQDYDDSFNSGEVKNRERRFEKGSIEAKARLQNEPNHEERRRETVRFILEPPDPITRTYLLDLYGGKCQICERTFPDRTGKPFFIACHFVERKQGRIFDAPANSICLCPEHFAKWQHGSRELPGIKDQIFSPKKIEKDGMSKFQIKIALCGDECLLTYKEKHFIDLQSYMKTLGGNLKSEGQDFAE